jgi:hypothetical protein
MYIDYVHKSNLNLIKRCSKQLYYKNIMKLKRSLLMNRLNGQAFHSLLNNLYLINLISGMTGAIGLTFGLMI